MKKLNRIRYWLTPREALAIYSGKTRRCLYNKIKKAEKDDTVLDLGTGGKYAIQRMDAWFSCRPRIRLIPLKQIDTKIIMDVERIENNTSGKVLKKMIPLLCSHCGAAVSKINEALESELFKKYGEKL